MSSEESPTYLTDANIQALLRDAAELVSLHAEAKQPASDDQTRLAFYRCFSKLRQVTSDWMCKRIERPFGGPIDAFSLGLVSPNEETAFKGLSRACDEVDRAEVRLALDKQLNCPETTNSDGSTTWLWEALDGRIVIPENVDAVKEIVDRWFTGNICPVKMLDDGCAIVKGKKKPLSVPEHRTVKALADCFPAALHMRQLDKACGEVTDSRTYLYALRDRDPDWAEVLYFPDKRKDGFRIKRTDEK